MNDHVGNIKGVAWQHFHKNQFGNEAKFVKFAKIKRRENFPVYGMFFAAMFLCNKFSKSMTTKNTGLKVDRKLEIIIFRRPEVSRDSSRCTVLYAQLISHFPQELAGVIPISFTW